MELMGKEILENMIFSHFWPYFPCLCNTDCFQTKAKKSTTNIIQSVNFLKHVQFPATWKLGPFSHINIYSCRLVGLKAVVLKTTYFWAK